jgi:hypothetical protein
MLAWQVHAGSVDEFDHEQGVAHLVEHVTFLGSKKRERMLGTGARSNAYTDFHHTVFHMHAPVTTADGTPLLPQVCGGVTIGDGRGAYVRRRERRRWQCMACMVAGEVLQLGAIPRAPCDTARINRRTRPCPRKQVDLTTGTRRGNAGATGGRCWTH